MSSKDQETGQEAQDMPSIVSGMQIWLHYTVWMNGFTRRPHPTKALGGQVSLVPRCTLGDTTSIQSSSLDTPF